MAQNHDELENHLLLTNSSVVQSQQLITIKWMQMGDFAIREIFHCVFNSAMNVINGNHRLSNFKSNSIQLNFSIVDE